MNFFIDALKPIPEYHTLLSGVAAKKLPASVTGLSAIHKAHLIQALSGETGRPAFVLAGDAAAAARLCEDLNAMGGRAALYPYRDFSFRDVESMSREYEHQRLHTLSRLLHGDCTAVVACLDAASQLTIPPEELSRRLLTIKAGQSLTPQRAAEVLLALGYVRYDQIEGPGQFAVRGGILDFFTPDAPAPVRAEFWGDEVDTLSYFDIESQRRTDPVDVITLAPSAEVILDDKDLLSVRVEELAAGLRGKAAAKAKEKLAHETQKLRDGLHIGNADKFLPLLYGGTASLFDYIGEEFLVFVSEEAKAKEQLRSTLWQNGEDLKDYLEEGVLCKGLDCYTRDWIDALAFFGARGAIYVETFARGVYETPVRTALHMTARGLSSWSGALAHLTEDLDSMRGRGFTCVVLAGTTRAAQAVEKDLCAQGYEAKYEAHATHVPPGALLVTEGNLSAGFEYPSAKFALIAYGRPAASPQKARRKKQKHTQDIYALSELSPGDLVVHTSHGIGQFDGIHKLLFEGVTKDYIKIRYAKSDILYVPVTQLDLVSKYIGPREDAGVKLGRLGGEQWQKAKARVRLAVKDMAKDLIKLYAERQNAIGHAFAPDTEWQRDFEAHFEYDETHDQLRCIEEIKEDMEKPSPMDRLLCGDVGFGKTEVALRAAFKCVSDSMQCAMLVPTTILAWQHYQTVTRRMEAFPVRVELLSRFRSPKQQNEIIKKVKNGEVDIVIGTHRLVSKDVSFKNLGLVVVDEEQRFGVAQKEKLKNLVKNVDSLTLSATPIPRTLNMALSGIRDMSVIEEAPQDRHPVQTYVLEYDAGIVLEAIKKELRRGGQCYYLHNAVESIETVAARLGAQLPGVRIGVGHGKMGQEELSAVWQRLIEHEIDVLVCTTIIEAGVDVPNCNTLIIDHADRMGLSQLHQLRGRVGRSGRRAYAYFTFTRGKVLSDIAQKRLTAIREFTEFGSGFKIAMRDLEIRGAGNVLGAEQHGHMEAVGYDMYLKLLAEAVALEKGEIPQENVECLVDIQIEAHIPESYIESLHQRLDVYRRIADIRSDEDSLDVTDELIDRFGEPPAAVRGLIEVALLRNRAAAYGITEIKQQGANLLIYQQSMDMRLIALLCGRMKGRVLMNAGGKETKGYLSVKCRRDSISTLRETLAHMDEVREFLSAAVAGEGRKPEENEIK